jgi:hypothetical protein
LRNLLLSARGSELKFRNPKSEIRNLERLMLFRQSEKKDTDQGLIKLQSGELRIHSIPTRARGRRFDGSFNVGDMSYELSYAPAKLSVAGGRLQFEGRLTVKDSRGQSRVRDRVRGTLVGTQGGIGTPPSRPGNPTSSATASSDLPDVESTGTSSFCGVMYIHFEPLSGKALGVPADMTRVQLNARFAPVDEVERTLQAIYSSAVNALFGKPPSTPAAQSAVSELNAILARS